ncbi:MAG: AAA family ATPase, partial [Clostridia bacterium]|nr:AAA family ATPase [Clostridia bacterium]
FIQIDTTNILFICAGSFAGIERIVEKRMGNSGLGFGAEIKSKKEFEDGKVMHEVVTQDLVKFGLIPELVGRLPIITALDDLDEDMLVRIMSEPKNALIKQYKYLFSIDGVELKFTEDALRALAQKTLKAKTGARGLRSIIEKVLLQYMYDIPSENSEGELIITEEVINGEAEPVFTVKE